MKPGEYLLDSSAGPIEANANRKTRRVAVKNTGDRPIQVGSHFHFFETNTSLSFDRAMTYAMRLNIASGTAVRFEPGQEKEVELTDFAGSRIVHGFQGWVEGSLDDPATRAAAMESARKAGLLSQEEGTKR
jgi:urease subunit beta